MTPELPASYREVTELPGQPASRIQLEMLEARYAWAAGQAGEKDILEAACGAGLGLPALAAVARTVKAGDIDPENLQAAAAVCAGRPNTAVRAFDAGELPFHGESFDLVLLFEAVYYLADLQRFLNETQRVLRPGGKLLMVTVNPEWDGFNPSPLCTRYWFAADLLAALHEGGFAARLQGAFPETTGWTAAATRWVRRRAVALRLVPRTMRGKALLKRIFYGPLRAVPGRAGASTLPTLDEIGPAGSRRHRVLYATAQKRAV